MNLNSKIYIAGHRGLAGSAIGRELQRQGYANLVGRTHASCPLINVGSGEELTIRELAETVAGVVIYRGRFVQDTSKPDGGMRKVMDVSRICGLGWRPVVSLTEGIKLAYGDFVARCP